MGNRQKCMIIGAVPVSERLFIEYDPEDYYVICADAGYETAMQNGIRPDLIVGDFDSATKPPPDTLNCLTLPVAKDVTDTMYAVMRALSIGLREYVLLGCLGGSRLDHTIANFDVLQYIINHGGIGEMADENMKAILLKERRMRITESKGCIVSVFPYAGATCNVTYRGLKYPLKHKTLHTGGTIMGVSNEIISDIAEITVNQGTALVLMFNQSSTI